MRIAIIEGGRQPEPGEDVMPMCAGVALGEVDANWRERCTCVTVDERIARMLTELLNDAYMQIPRDLRPGIVAWAKSLGVTEETFTFWRTEGDEE